MTSIDPRGEATVRAWVTRRGGRYPSWIVYIYDSTGRTEYRPRFSTHAEALAHALAAVGLAPEEEP